MKVLFFEPFAIFSPHYETCLELVQNHIDQGNNVTLVGCDASFQICYPNPSHNLYSCLSCISRRNAGLKALADSSKVSYVSFDYINSQYESDYNDGVPSVNSIDELRQLVVGNYEIGSAVLSSLMSIELTPEPEYEKNKAAIQMLINSAYRCYCGFVKYLEVEKPDQVYIFNGRFSLLRSVLRACQRLGIDCFIHERGSSIKKYSLYKNHLPHDLKARVFEIRSHWIESKDQNKDEIASQYFLDRANGKEQSWFSFVNQQKHGLLPDTWASHKKNIVIFNSSEDEFASIGDEWKNPLYGSQLEGIERIASSLSTCDEFNIYLRIHPNLKDVKNNSVAGLYKIKYKNFFIIPPDSEISTYALVQAAEKVISFGSTVGIEAAFWNKPSILAGQCFYRELGSVYLPNSHDELIHMVIQNLPPKNKLGALIYGYYLNTYGIDFIHFKPTGLFSGYLSGKVIEMSNLAKIMSYLDGKFFKSSLTCFLIKLAKAGII